MTPNYGPYFETVPTAAEALALARAAASDQNAAVLAIMHRYARPMTPWDCWMIGRSRGREWLITSVRRSMTVLSTGEGAPLVKLDTLSMGPHGKPSHEWCTAEYAAAMREQAHEVR